MTASKPVEMLYSATEAFLLFVGLCAFLPRRKTARSSSVSSPSTSAKRFACPFADTRSLASFCRVPVLQPEEKTSPSLTYKDQAASPTKASTTAFIARARSRGMHSLKAIMRILYHRARKNSNKKSARMVCARPFVAKGGNGYERKESTPSNTARAILP